MKLRIQVEGKLYDVDVDVLDDSSPLPEPETGSANRPKIAIPPAVVRPRQAQKLLEDTFCRSPIAGRITAVLAEPGRQVRKNDAVLVIEAMKMEIKIGPAVDGVIAAIRVKPGESVSTGQVLFELA